MEKNNSTPKGIDQMILLGKAIDAGVSMNGGKRLRLRLKIGR